MWEQVGVVLSKNKNYDPSVYFARGVFFNFNNFFDILHLKYYDSLQFFPLQLSYYFVHISQLICLPHYLTLKRR